VTALAQAAQAAARELELQFARAEQQEIELTEAERWARDPIGWINAHVWIASVFGSDGIRAKVRALRMRLFPDQEATIDAWIDLPHLAATGELVFRNIDAEKSRQIGETWLFAAAICWLLHYHRSIVGGCLHTVGAEIDDGGERNTIKSLFGKIRYIDRRLDRARTPGLGDLRFWPLSNQGPAKIENQANGAVVYGEGQKDNPFRGSTLDFALIDEAAFVRHGEQVHAAIDDACPDGKAYVSTVNGDDNIHARIADERPEGWTVLRLHWSNHPVYSQGLHVAAALEHDERGSVVGVAEPGDPECEMCAGVLAGVEWSPRDPRAHRYPGKLASPWYDQRVIGKTDEQVARELDIDREGALGARVYGEFQTERHVVAAGIPLDPSLPVEFAWDFGLDCTSVIVLQDAPHELRAVALLEMGDLFGTTAVPQLVAAALRELLVSLGVQAQHTTPFWTKKMQGWGDPAGDGRSTQTGISDIQEYAKQGFSILTPPRRLTMRVETSIVAVKRLLIGTPKPLVICGVKAEGLARHFRNNTWPVDPISQKRRKGATRPLDDVHNHSLRAFAYYAVAKYPPPTEYDAQDGPTGDIGDDGDNVRERRSRRGVTSTLSYGMKF
jgi:hypothetical protein